MGAKVVGIIDRVGGLINTEGYSLEEITALFQNKKGNMLVADELLSFDEVNSKIWDLNAEIFIPCAASRLITRDQVDRMKNAGMEVIACGANVPFADEEIFFGPISEYADQNLSVIPDFISNCGMARVFAYLMGTDVELTDEAIFMDISRTIRNALAVTHQKNNDTKNISATALELSLEQLLA
jgi:glutamate dehydrogenase/leucine dehydrogenase